MEIAISIIISLACGVMFAQRGDGMRKFLWVSIMTAFAYGLNEDVARTLAYLYVFGVVGCLPTSPLFSAGHGVLPGRTDGRWQWIQSIAFFITKKMLGSYSQNIWPNCCRTKWARIFGITYGVVRGAIAIPAIVFLGKYWLLLTMGYGFFIFLMWKTEIKKPIRAVEFIIGCIIGANL